MINDLIIYSAPYFCKRISKDDYDDLQDFAVRVRNQYGYALQAFIQEQALSEDDKRLNNTFIVRNIQTLEVVAYFSLRSGMISANERRVQFRRVFDTVPGVELSNFAVNDNYIRKHNKESGVGAIVFSDFIIPIVDQASKYVGISVIYIYALPEKNLISRYRQYGFERLEKRQERSLHRRFRPYYDEGCIFMYIGL